MHGTIEIALDTDDRIEYTENRDSRSGIGAYTMGIFIDNQFYNAEIYTSFPEFTLGVF